LAFVVYVATETPRELSGVFVRLFCSMRQRSMGHVSNLYLNGLYVLRSDSVQWRYFQMDVSSVTTMLSMFWRNIVQW
jgi:hypothetical protein